MTENDRGADTGITLSFDGSYSGISGASFIITGRDGEVDNRFEVVNESGAWKLKLKATRFLDAEQGTKINLNIALNDVSVDVQIAVNNVNGRSPDFTEDTYRGNDFTDHFTLYEDAKIGTVIHEFEITEDVGREGFHASFADSGGIRTRGDKFILFEDIRIDEETGRERIFVRIELARELDYEEYTRLKTGP